MLSDYQYLRILFFLALLLLMFMIEGKWPARSWLDRRFDRLLFSAKLAVINNLIMKLLVLAPFLWWSNFVSERGWGLSGLLGLEGLALVMSTIVVFDCLDSIKHLLFHRLNFMWRLHRAHHTDTHLDIFTSLRYHPGEFVVSALIKSFWILVWGPSAIAFLCFEVVLNCASQYHHSNIKLPQRIEKYLNKIIVTPSYHALHHTINRARGDQNFATIFSFWDYIFGNQLRPGELLVDLERLEVLQEKHLSLADFLKSPLNQDPPVKKGSSDLLMKKFLKIAREMSAGEAVLIDVRGDSEILKAGAVKEAIHFPWASFKKDRYTLHQFRRKIENRKVYIFCSAGLRAKKAADKFSEAGSIAIAIGGFSDLSSGPWTTLEAHSKNLSLVYSNQN